MDNHYEVKVNKIEQVTNHIKTFTFSSSILPQFGAGAHITLHLPMGARQYSLITDPLDMKNEYVIAVKNLGNNGGSAFLHQDVREGDVLEVSGPNNYFPLHLEANHHVFFAAGIGITPFLSMMAYLTMLGKSFELHYVASSREDCAFYSELMARYSEATTFYFMPRSEKVNRIREALMNRKVGTHVYVCGPESFMNMVVDATNELQYPKSVVHLERFSPVTISEASESFTVSVNGYDERIEVGGEQSLLEALHDNGISVPYACRMGICGSCEVQVCEGNVVHRDTFLTDEEKREKMLSCVSRGVGHLSISIGVE